jgi:hypothetical protein
MIPRSSMFHSYCSVGASKQSAGCVAFSGQSLESPASSVTSSIAYGSDGRHEKFAIGCPGNTMVPSGTRRMLTARSIALA